MGFYLHYFNENNFDNWFRNRRWTPGVRLCTSKILLGIVTTTAAPAVNLFF